MRTLMLTAALLISAIALGQVTDHGRYKKIDTLVVVALTDSGNVKVTGWVKGDSAYFRAYGNLPSAVDTGSISIRINADSTDQAKRTLMNSYRNADSLRAIVRETADTTGVAMRALMNTYRGADTTRMKVIMVNDTTGIAMRALMNTYRGADSARAIVREAADTTGLAAGLAGKATAGDTTGFASRTLMNTYRGADTTRMKVFMVNDTTGMSLLAPKASPTFTGTPVLPTPFTVGAVSMTATGTELNYVAGVTGAIQTQLNGKVATTVTVNGHALSSNVTVTTTDLSLNNLTNDAQVKKAEIAPMFSVGLDSTMINVNDKYPIGELSFSVTLDTVVFIMSGGAASPSVTPVISWGTDISAAGNSIGALSAVTSKTTATKVANTTAIASGNSVWLTFSTAGSTVLPNKFQAILVGHRP